MPHRLITAIIVAALAGCCASRQASTAPSDLKSQVGKNVRLEGKFGGPGKQADFVVLNGEGIYLMGSIDSGSEKLQYGSSIAVQGVLKFQKFVAPQPPDPLMQVPPDYFFIENPRVEVLRRPGITP